MVCEKIQMVNDNNIGKLKKQLKPPNGQKNTKSQISVKYII